MVKWCSLLNCGAAFRSTIVLKENFFTSFQLGIHEVPASALHDTTWLILDGHIGWGQDAVTAFLHYIHIYVLCWDTSHPWHQRTSQHYGRDEFCPVTDCSSSQCEGMCNKKALCLTKPLNAVLPCSDSIRLENLWSSSVLCFKLPSCASAFDGFGLYIHGLVRTDRWLQFSMGQQPLGSTAGSKSGKNWCPLLHLKAIPPWI